MQFKYFSTAPQIIVQKMRCFSLMLTFIVLSTVSTTEEKSACGFNMALCYSMMPFYREREKENDSDMLEINCYCEVLPRYLDVA